MLIIVHINSDFMICLFSKNTFLVSKQAHFQMSKMDGLGLEWTGQGAKLNGHVSNVGGQKVKDWSM